MLASFMTHTSDLCLRPCPAVRRLWRQVFSSILSLVLITGVSVGQVVSVGQNCSQTGTCPGGRSRTVNGCCPAGVGQSCSVRLGVECDTDLGYWCAAPNGSLTGEDGTCKGRHGLNVTNVQDESVLLEWQDFRPEDYLFEYALLYRKNAFSNVTSNWTILDIGTKSTYTLQNLSPLTLYFIRVAIWQDPYDEILGEMSEVVYVNTTGTVYCLMNGNTYTVGMTVENCEDRCTCQEDGQFTCVALCPESSLPEVPEGCSLQRLDECSCNVTVQCPQKGENTTTSTTLLTTNGTTCRYKNRTYEDGAEWVDYTTCGSCSCSSSNVTCLNVCTEPEVPEGCRNPQRRPSATGCCDVIECNAPEEECHHNGTLYQVGQVFTSDCSLCLCSYNNYVNCSVSCSPLLLPVPSIMCPFPHVRHDGCCDTVWCMIDNVDIGTLISRLMAISYGPDSLTISFDLGTTITTTQERFEVMTSSVASDVTSWRSQTFTPRLVNSDDNASSIADILHADAAIQVDERVFITLEGLTPNTTYFVRVQPVVARDMAVTEAEQMTRNLTGFIVAMTKEKETSCQVNGVTFRERDVVQENCREVCRCLSGLVQCTNLCPDEDVVTEPSTTCPEPKLVRVEGDCCKTWKCFPEEGGCTHENLIIRNGEEVYDGSCEKRCTCINGQITCQPVCQLALPVPRTDCVLRNITGTCCPVWMCPQGTTVKREDINLTAVNISSSSVSFEWQSLASSSLAYITGLVISFRLETETFWNQTTVLPPGSRRYTLSRLQAGRRYLARLVALTNTTLSGLVWLPISVVKFITNSPAVLTARLVPDSFQVSLSQTSVTINWKPLTFEDENAVSKLLVTYRKSGDAEDIGLQELKPLVSQLTLVNLSSNTVYVVNFYVVFANGTQLELSTLHFVTSAEDISSVLLIPLIATSSIFVLLVLMVTITFYVWRHMRKKSLLETSFENKIFGVSIIRCNKKMTEVFDDESVSTVSSKEDKSNA